jgi:beta-galactosidase
MGLTAEFSVAATGNPLNYQWAKNSMPIAGATGSTYNTPATAFSDNG